MIDRENRSRQPLSSLLLVVALVSPATSSQPEQALEDVWRPLRYFVGGWQGIGEGTWGTSRLTRGYAFVLGDSYLRATNRSVYEPQERNLNGERHENWDFYSYDRQREVFVLR